MAIARFFLLKILIGAYYHPPTRNYYVIMVKGQLAEAALRKGLVDGYDVNIVNCVCSLKVLVKAVTKRSDGTASILEGACLASDKIYHKF